MVQYLIVAVIVIGVLLLTYAVSMMLSKRDRVKAGLRDVSEHAAYDDDDQAPPAAAIFAEKTLGLMNIDVSKQRETQIELQQAGIQSNFAVNYYLFFKRILQPIILVIGLYIFLTTILADNTGLAQKAQGFIILLILLVIGAMGAKLYVTNRRQKREKILLNSFPETLDLLLVCIESGLGLDAALVRTGNELHQTHPIMAKEIERTRIELAMLSDRTQALKNLGERTGIQPMRSLVSSLIQTEQFGTSLVDTLRVLSEEQRITRLMTAEQKAARIPVLITIPLIVCIMPVLFVVILAPPFIKMHYQGGMFGAVENR